MPALTTLAVPSVPAAPPSPTDTVPASIRSVPANVLDPVTDSVPAPACVIVPVPDIVFGRASVSARLNTRSAFTVTAPVPSDPDVPPSPTRSVPPVIVVTPE